MKYTFYYGIRNNKIDITKGVMKKCLDNNMIYIPANETIRCFLFTDVMPYVLKSIFVQTENKLIEYSWDKNVYIDLETDQIYVNHLPDNRVCINPTEELLKLHGTLQNAYGSFRDEFPEQDMVYRFLKGKEKVLEIGANHGRNSLIISYILNQNNNFNMVSLETNAETSAELKHNRDLNHHHFHIENSALSNRKLIQCGWDTKPSEVLEKNHFWVKTISWKELNDKYNIVFDTLILDCEGAFYYILLDMPEILDNINLIIMENDYKDISHKEYINNVLKKNGFNVVYTDSGGWGPCYDFFYEVWKK
jgi:FkbM family methyltransferase